MVEISQNVLSKWLWTRSLQTEGLWAICGPLNVIIYHAKYRKLWEVAFGPWINLTLRKNSLPTIISFEKIYSKKSKIQDRALLPPGWTVLRTTLIKLFVHFAWFENKWETIGLLSLSLCLLIGFIVLFQNIYKNISITITFLNVLSPRPQTYLFLYIE